MTSPADLSIVLDARQLVGWSQRELAARAKTSPAMIWRIETGQHATLELGVAERVLAALGIRCTLGIDDRHLADRRRQRDRVHARLNGYVARRLDRLGWLVASEVPLGAGPPRGRPRAFATRRSSCGSARRRGP